MKNVTNKYLSYSLDTFYNSELLTVMWIFRYLVISGYSMTIKG